MVIKNKTLFQKEYVEAAMRAGNFDDNKYKFFKIVYNMFGLLFGMGLVRYLVFQAIGSDEADWFMVVFYGCAAAIFLYIGMVGMDRSNKRRYYNTYSRMVGITFTYEIDADGIIVTGTQVGEETPLDLIKRVKNVVNLPVFAGSGVNAENIHDQLQTADGAIIGSSLKEGGILTNPISYELVKKVLDGLK